MSLSRGEARPGTSPSCQRFAEGGPLRGRPFDQLIMGSQGATGAMRAQGGHRPVSLDRQEFAVSSHWE